MILALKRIKVWPCFCSGYFADISGEDLAGRADTNVAHLRPMGCCGPGRLNRPSNWRILKNFFPCNNLTLDAKRSKKVSTSLKTLNNHPSALNRGLNFGCTKTILALNMKWFWKFIHPSSTLNTPHTHVSLAMANVLKYMLSFGHPPQRPMLDERTIQCVLKAEMSH